MAHMDVGLIGQRVTDYRLRAGLTQQDLAREAGMERTALAKVESGQRRVTALELAALARALDVRMDWFVKPSADAIVAYRSALAPDAPTAAIDRLIETLSRHGDFVVEQGSQGFPLLAGAERALRNRDEAEEFARVARGWLGLNSVEPINDIAGVASSVGALLFSLDLGRDAPEGASVVAERCGIVVVNGFLKVGRRRLVAAHELGHLLTRDGYQVDWRIDALDQSQAETRLDQFARALLLPDQALRQALEARADRELREVAIRLGSEYQVDMATLARRLLDLGLVSGEEASFVRAIRTGQADIVDLDLVVRDDLNPPSAPRIYQKAVLSLFKADTITASRAVDLLVGTLAEADLPERPPIPEAAAWAVL